GGRSSLYAIGSPPGRFGGRWEITLHNPVRPESPLGVFFLRNRALGTSGATFQQFVADGRVYGPILDPPPRQARPRPASRTALAPTAAIADALSTAFYLLGPVEAATYIESHPDVGAVFVERGPDESAPRLSVFGLGEQDFFAEAGTLR